MGLAKYTLLSAAFFQNTALSKTFPSCCTQIIFGHLEYSSVSNSKSYIHSDNGFFHPAEDTWYHMSVWTFHIIFSPTVWPSAARSCVCMQVRSPCRVRLWPETKGAGNDHCMDTEEDETCAEGGSIASTHLRRHLGQYILLKASAIQWMLCYTCAQLGIIKCSRKVFMQVLVWEKNLLGSGKNTFRQKVKVF